MQGARYQHCDGNAGTFETRQRRAGCGICTQETRDAAGSADLRWRASSPTDCPGLLEAASRLRPLDASIACRQSCGTQIVTTAHFNTVGRALKKTTSSRTLRNIG